MIAAGGWGDQGVHFSLGVPSLQASGTRGAFRKSLVPCSSCARMTAPHARGHVASLHECALLHAAQRDDRRAQEELLRRYEPLIRATVHRLRLPCRCDCSDIAQEARIGLLSAIRAWQPTRGPFRAFAARCAIAQVIKALDTAGARKHQVLSRALSLEVTVRAKTSPDAGEIGCSSPFHQLVAATRHRADPVATVLAREQLGRMLAALPALTLKERAALTWVLNGKSQQQLADEQGSTRKAVKAALRRARDKLAVQEALAPSLNAVELMDRRMRLAVCERERRRSPQGPGVAASICR